MNPRLYRGYDDLEKIQNLFRDGLRAHPHRYMHTGDIEWWLFYNPIGEPPEESVYLWEDASGNVLAWVLVTPAYAEFDIFMHPSTYKSQLEADILAWAEATLTPQVNIESPSIQCRNVFADHHTLRALLETQGFTATPEITLFEQDLTQDLTPPSLPHGYYFLEHMDESLCEKRADVHVSAFISSRMTTDYYRTFIQMSPMYNPANDIVLCLEEDERFIAFAMTWYDAILKRGEFEPVGTRDEFQNKGLGKAVMREGLRRLKAQGATYASVCCAADIPVNQMFYRACGFTPVNTVYTYSKMILKD
jgi:mycothiol synthase